jgi:hypothetical protein
MSYARKTKVPASQSRAEIERLLQKYGASHFAFGSTPTAVNIGFQLQGRIVRFSCPMPHHEQQAAEYRRRWRALTLCIKAKLESVASSIETFDEAFMAQIVLPNGRTMSQHAQPLIAEAYKSNKLPALLERF